MNGVGPRRWLLLGVIGVVAVSAGIAYRGRPVPEQPPSRPPAPPPAAEAQPPALAVLPAPPLVKPEPAATTSSRLAAATSGMKRLRSRLPAQVQEVLASRGGAAAVDMVRTSLQEKPQTLDDTLRCAFLVRLLPWIAKKDPSAAGAAFALEFELLHREGLDAAVRYQAVAGLAGLSSTNVTLGAATRAESPESNPAILAIYQVEDVDPDHRDEYDESLAALCAKDEPATHALLTLLASDASEDVRQAAASSLRLLAPAGAVGALQQALRADEDPFVRQECLRSLAKIDSANFLETVQSLSRGEQNSTVLTEAFRLLPDAVPYGPSARKLVGECAVAENLQAVRPAIAQAAFSWLRSGASSDLEPVLMSMLQQNPGEDLVPVFTDQAVRSGMVEFLPMFRSLLQAGGAPVPAHDQLEDAVHKLENLPYYSGLAAEIDRNTSKLRGLISQLDRTDLPQASKDALSPEIDQVYAQLSKLREQYRQK